MIGCENLDPHRGFASHLIFQNDKLWNIAAEAVAPPLLPAARGTDSEAKDPAPAPKSDAPAPKAADTQTATKSKSTGRCDALLLKFGLLKVPPKAPDSRGWTCCLDHKNDHWAGNKYLMFNSTLPL